MEGTHLARKIIWALACVTSLTVLGIVLYPLLVPARSFGGPNKLSYLKQLSWSVYLYTNDNNDTYPPCDIWSDATERYANRGMYFLRRPSERPQIGLSAAMNGLLDKAPLAQTNANLEHLVTLFVMQGEQWNAWGGPANIYWWPGTEPSTVIAFGDSHVSRVKPAKLTTLRWRPHTTLAQSPAR